MTWVIRKPGGPGVVYVTPGRCCSAPLGGDNGRTLFTYSNTRGIAGLARPLHLVPLPHLLQIMREPEEVKLQRVQRVRE